MKLDAAAWQWLLDKLLAAMKEDGYVVSDALLVQPLKKVNAHAGR
jgi:hypothetical protein